MIKRLELSTPTSCINKAADDEPVFVLRAHDKFAPHAIRYWARLAEAAGCPAKVQEAFACAEQMDDWAAAHDGGKVPD